MRLSIYICSALLAIGLLSSCAEKWNILKDFEPSTGAQLRFVHAAPDVPAINVFVNEKLVSGAAVTVTNPTGSLVYGAIFPAFEYSATPVGAAKIKVVAATGGNAASPLLATDVALEAGKRYSVFASGVAPTYSLVAVPDEIPPVSGNTLFIRVVNLVPNSTNVTLTYDGKDVATDIAPGKTSAFVSIPFPADYKIGTIRTANIGAKVNGIIPVVTGTTFLATAQPGAVITLVVRGVMTTDAKVPTKYAVGVSSYLSR